MKRDGGMATGMMKTLEIMLNIPLSRSSRYKTTAGENDNARGAFGARFSPLPAGFRVAVPALRGELGEALAARPPPLLVGPGPSGHGLRLGSALAFVLSSVALTAVPSLSRP